MNASPGQIIYDLEQLPQEHRLPLKDTLVTALRNASAPTGASSSRAIVTQLCIAVADLLLQLPEWQNALQEMIDQLGSSPGTVAALLEFLSILPEEANTNRRIREPVRLLAHPICRSAATLVFGPG